VELQVPTLYVMGNEDYMFLPSVRKVVESHYKTSQLVVFENCGYRCAARYKFCGC
jgi:hypothetical protein